MITRARKISFALRKANVANYLNSIFEIDTGYTAWTSFFAADPVSAHICSQVANSRRAFLKSKRVVLKVQGSALPDPQSNTKKLTPRSRSGSKLLGNPNVMRIFNPTATDPDAYLSGVAHAIGSPEISDLRLEPLTPDGRSPIDSSLESGATRSSPEQPSSRGSSPGEAAVRFLKGTTSPIGALDAV
jgi:hypothetical protein